MWIKIGKIKLIIAVLMLFLNPLQAQHKAYFEISSNEVALSETFQLSLVLEQPEKGASYSFPPPAGFQVLGGPNKGQSFSNINGKTTQTYTISYYLRPQKTGQFTISNAYYIGPSKQKEAVKAITINVSKDGNVNIPKNKNIFAVIETNKNEAYVGQAIKAKLKIYVRQGMPNQILKSELTESQSVWMEREANMEPYTKRKVLNGMSFTEVTIDEFLLFPQKSGPLSIGPWDTEINIPVSFFQDKQVKLKAPAKELKIKPLPNGVSASNVGAYDLSYELSEGPFSSGSPIDFKVKIKGTGNFTILNPDFLADISEDIDVYDPKIINKTTITSNGRQGFKEWQYILMPTIDGRYEIPAYELKTFDPFTGKVKLLKIPSQEIIVGKGSYASEGNSSDEVSRVKKEIELDSQQKAYLINDASIFMASWMYDYSFVLLLLFTLGLYIATRIFLQSKWYQQWISKKQVWNPVKALEDLDANDPNLAAKVDDILSQYFSTLFQLSKSDIVWSNVEYQLQIKAIDPSLIQEFKSHWDRINYSKYSGWNNNEQHECIQGVIRAIEQLNEKWS